MSQKYFSISASVFSDSHASVFCKHQWKCSESARSTDLSVGPNDILLLKALKKFLLLKHQQQPTYRPIINDNFGEWFQKNIITHQSILLIKYLHLLQYNL